MAVIETVCSQTMKLFSGVNFSAQTIYPRIREISENVKYNQKDCFEDLQFFSITIDESTDTTDTGQQPEFVGGVNGNFHVVEKFVQLLPMVGTSGGSYLWAAKLQPPHALL